MNAIVVDVFDGVVSQTQEMSSDVQGNNHQDADKKPDEARPGVIRQFVLEQLVDDGSGK